jgi:hypothetical protein
MHCPRSTPSSQAVRSGVDVAQEKLNRGGMATPRTISLDAMGGDRGPAMVVPGAALALERHPQMSFLLYGNKDRVEPFLLAYPELAERSKIVHTETQVEMQDKPSQAVRRGRGSSMWLSSGRPSPDSGRPSRVPASCSISVPISVPLRSSSPTSR